MNFQLVVNVDDLPIGCLPIRAIVVREMAVRVDSLFLALRRR
jgi:hypothetical protein